MAKTLNQFLEGYLKVKNPDEQKFVDKHVVAKHSDRNGNDDEVFKGSKVKPIDRRKDRHGYNPGEDEKVYEELKGNQHKIDANKNGRIDAEDFKHLRKKKKVAEAADDPKLAFQLHMAKKREELRKKGQLAKEEAEQIDELSTDTLQSYRKKARAQGNAIVDKMKMGGGDWSKDQKDTKTLRKRAAGAQASGKQLVKRGESLKTEEAEQIDELSNDTLRRYRMKAKSIADHGGEQRTKGRELAGRKSYGGRMAGIEKAKVMAKEEVEQIDETAKIVAHLQKRYGDNIRKSHVRSAASDFGVDASKLAKAVRTKLGKNMLDEEQLDELSPATKASYMKKAGGEIDKLYDKSKTDSRSAYKYYGRKNTMRKIANEEAELEEKLNMDKASMGDVIKDFQDSNAPQFKGKSKEKRRAMAIAAKLTAERGGKPLRKEERLADILGDLTESHRRTMLSVFDKLNESNQKKFLEACETPEGVESMLDFSISHRGE